MNLEEIINLKSLQEILERYPLGQSSLVPILHQIQEYTTHIPLNMVRFYNLFTFESKGRHLINVCLGTVCHIKGGGELLRELERELGLNCGETTSDFMFTLDKVRCLGCWSLAPVVKVDKRIYSWCKGEEYAQSFTW